MKPPLETEADEDCHFFRLPPEIRLTIYELAIETSSPRYFMNLGHLPKRPPLLTTNRFIRSEAMKAYYRHLKRESLSTSSTYIFQSGCMAYLQHVATRGLFSANFWEHRWKEYTKVQDACLRAAAALRLEDSRLAKDGWPVKKWSREIQIKWQEETVPWMLESSDSQIGFLKK